MTDLLPCPFCGAPGKLHADHPKCRYVQCDPPCAESLGHTYRTVEEAVRLWNTRAPSPEVAALKAQLADAVAIIRRAEDRSPPGSETERQCRAFLTTYDKDQSHGC